MRWAFAIALFFVLTGVVSQTKVIHVIVTSHGNQKSTRLEYEAPDGYRGIKSVEPGKLRFYIEVDKDCKIRLNRKKGTVITGEEADALELALSAYKIKYTENGVTETDCAAFSGESFPISVTTVRN